jgi:uncharacterized membrane protein YozB (DUF420 family)
VKIFMGLISVSTSMVLIGLILIWNRDIVLSMDSVLSLLTLVFITYLSGLYVGANIDWNDES